MAEKAASDVDVIMFKCTICKGIMKESWILKCHHSFCTPCLKTLQVQGCQRSDKLSCPTCHRITAIKKGSVDSLLDNFKTENLSELFSQQDELAACVACPTSLNIPKQPPDFYCNQCHDYLCQSCGEKHKKALPFTGHSLTPLDHHLPVRQHCDDHPMKYNDYFCQDCQLLICSACVTVKHEDHRVAGFEQFNYECRQEIKARRADLETRLEQSDTEGLLDDGIRTIVRSDLLEITVEVSKRINDKADSMIRDINGQRNGMIALMHKYNGELMKRLCLDELKYLCDVILCLEDPLGVVTFQKQLLEKVTGNLAALKEEKVPELSLDTNIVYTDVSPVQSEITLGSLSKMSLREFVEWKKPPSLICHPRNP